MEREYNLEEALKILMDCYLTDSIQTLRKWIRDGKIRAISTSYRQGGYKIKESDLVTFIDEERLGLLDMVRVYKEKVDNIPLSVTSLFKEYDTSAESSKEEIKDEVINEKQTKTENTDYEEERKNQDNLLQNRSNEEDGKYDEFFIQFEQKYGSTIQKLEKLDKIEKDNDSIKAKIENDFNKFDNQYVELKNEIKKLKEEIQLVKNSKNKSKNKQNKSDTNKNQTNDNSQTDELTKSKDKNNFIKLFKQFYNEVSGAEINDQKQVEKFEKLAVDAYKLFYDGGRYFREEIYRVDKEKAYEIVVDKKVIAGDSRWELVLNYFNEVFYPELKVLFNNEKNTEPSLGHNMEDNQDEVGDIEPVDFKDSSD